MSSESMATKYPWTIWIVIGFFALASSLVYLQNYWLMACCLVVMYIGVGMNIKAMRRNGHSLLLPILAALLILAVVFIYVKWFAPSIERMM